MTDQPAADATSVQPAADAPSAQPTADAASVRAELRRWIDAHWDPELSLVQWRGLLADSGWACPAWPLGWCGRSLPPGVAEVVTGGLADAGVPGPAEGVGRTLAAPALLSYGSEDLKRRFIRPTVTSEITWCQLFSEPGAGSDLAGLATRAEPVKGDSEGGMGRRAGGGGWRVTGQKVWSTGAATADFGLLLARTARDARHMTHGT